ncbi:MAG: Rab family GTPase [Candidatus Hodarchaeales archaeon]|jgi:small GTP-binding protein
MGESYRTALASLTWGLDMQVPEYKITLLGDGEVGKTSLCNRYMRKGFIEDYMMTVGADISFKTLEVGKTRIKLQIWDIAGQPCFEAVRKSYFGGAIGALFVYDITRPETLENAHNWIEELWKHNEKGKVPVVLLGNKVDLRDSVPSAVTSEQGQLVAYELSDPTMDVKSEILHLETSAKTGKNVDEAFHALAEEIVKYVEVQLAR